jgi:hypothetical protein
MEWKTTIVPAKIVDWGETQTPTNWCNEQKQLGYVAEWLSKTIFCKSCRYMLLLQVEKNKQSIFSSAFSGRLS